MAEDWPTCPRCGYQPYHYMTHVCPGCTCWVTEARIPGEPQMPSYLEVEPNPDCPIHFTEEERADWAREKEHHDRQAAGAQPQVVPEAGDW